MVHSNMLKTVRNAYMIHIDLPNCKIFSHMHIFSPMVSWVRWKITDRSCWSLPGPARSGLPKKRVMVTRWSGNTNCLVVHCHTTNCWDIVIHSYIKILCTSDENQLFGCKLSKLEWSSRCGCFLWRFPCSPLRRAEDVWAYPNTSTCSNRCFGHSTAWMEATTRSNSWQVYDLQRSLHQPALTFDKHPWNCCCSGFFNVSRLKKTIWQSARINLEDWHFILILLWHLDYG